MSSSHLLYFYLLKGMNNQVRNAKLQYLPISVLNLPAKGALHQVPSPNPSYNLYYQTDKKHHMQSYKLSLPKTKLFPTLETYSWRHQTEFPISKVHYVNIRQRNGQENQFAEMVVYIEYCPLRVEEMGALSITQTVYVLKEAAVGFERLFKKFGAFKISQKMIRINQKGLCRVWMNQNFAYNYYEHSETSQQKMVKSIQQILSQHCQSFRASQKLFSRLSQCKTFISVLRQIDNFASMLKIIIPYKFSPSDSNSSKTSPGKSGRNQFTSARKAKIVRSEKEAMDGSWSIKESVSMEKANKNDSSHEIKKIMSSQNIGAPMTPSTMKKSDGETTYTRNVKTSNTGAYCLPRQRNLFDSKSRSKDKNKKKTDDTSLIIKRQKSSSKDKKNLYYSSSGINPEDNSISKTNNRSFSIQNISFHNFEAHSPNLNKKTQSHFYADQFASVLEDKSLQQSARYAKKMRSFEADIDEQVEKLRESHTETVIKNNGWKSFAGLLLQENQQLNQSFVEGQQENLFLKEIKLQKLESLGRRVKTMSILPEEFQQIL